MLYPPPRAHVGEGFNHSAMARVRVVTMIKGESSMVMVVVLSGKRLLRLLCACCLKRRKKERQNILYITGCCAFSRKKREGKRRKKKKKKSLLFFRSNSANATAYYIPYLTITHFVLHGAATAAFVRRALMLQGIAGTMAVAYPLSWSRKPATAVSVCVLLAACACVREAT